MFLIMNMLRAEDIQLSELQVRNLIRVQIPKKLAKTATRLRLESDLKMGRIEGLECSKCHQILPKDPFYFSRSRDKRTGYCSQCKECQRASRERRVLVKGTKTTQ